MCIEFLGNKRQLIDFIYNNISAETKNVPKKIFDIFSGTGTVGLKFKENNYEIISNDFLYFCTIFAKANLYNNTEPTFDCIMNDLPASIRNSTMPAYDKIIYYLNSLEGTHGYVYSNYSPASIETCGIERMYFSKENASKIDAIRLKIQEWKSYLSDGEEALLIADLLKGINSVSNIAGTYGCYMKYWKQKALKPINLDKTDIVKGLDPENHKVYNEEANNIAGKISAPIIYADPPYTKRQYSAYYHILETIAVGDTPDIIGKTGLRPWKDKNSDYCYKKKAPRALENLLTNMNCNYFFLSYNSDGQMSHDTILNILSKEGTVDYRELVYKRYRSNSLSAKKEPLKERLYILKL